MVIAGPHGHFGEIHYAKTCSVELGGNTRKSCPPGNLSMDQFPVSSARLTWQTPERLSPAAAFDRRFTSCCRTGQLRHSISRMIKNIEVNRSRVARSTEQP